MANVKLSQLPALASPTDTTSIPVVDGGVTKKITGSSLATYVNGKNTAYTLPTASTSTLGGVKVDGSSVTINNGVISVSTGLTGSVVFKGTWNASTNSPTLANGSGTSGWMYIVGTAGTQNLGGGSVTYNASDLIVYDGTNWIDIAANNGVVSFNTRTGAVTLNSSDVTTALGFTPYNATNPNSYLTTITSGQVTGALGYTPIQTSSLSVTTNSASGGGSLSYTGGVFTFTPYSLPSATTTSLGGVKVDNNTIVINNDTISVSSALTNAVQFKGGWDASSNTPTLGSGLPAGVAAGWEYIVSTAGTQNIGSGSIAYSANDLVIYNGTAWIRIPGSTSVVSFNTRQGAVTLTSSDVTTALGVQNANKVLAGPSTGADAAPTFRALVAADIPSLTSAQLATIVSDETGTGVAVFGTSPAITTSLTTASSSFDLINTSATTVNFAGAATTLSLGNTATAAQTVNLFTASTGASTYNFATGATLTATTKAINIGGGGVSGSTTNIALGSINSVSGALGTITHYGNTTLSSGSLTFSGDMSRAAWTTSGIRHVSVSAVLTDTTSTGTVANAYTNNFGGNTIAASNAVTYTNYGTVFLNDPAAGTNVTITNAYSLITAGNVKLGSTGTGTIAAVAATATTSSTAASVGYMGMPQQSKSSAYTTVIGDAGKHIYVTATATITIDSNANVAYPIGTTIAFIAAAGATVTIAITSDTMYLGGTGTTGSRTLAAYGMATAVKVTSTTWFINGAGLT